MRRQPLPSGFDPRAALHLLGSPAGQLQRRSTSRLGKMLRKKAGLRQEEVHTGGDRNRNERFQPKSSACLHSETHAFRGKMKPLTLNAFQ